MDSKMMIRADERTWDVLSSKTFDQLLLSSEIVNRLSALSFTKPTPVQAGAIPLGILGNDLLVQAKSGTGKTLVFATLIAHTVAETAADGIVAVVVAPVREIALQIKEVVDKIAPEGTRSCVFIGGEDVKDNKSMIGQGCSVAIGTPGRLAQLLREDALNFKNSKLFVLDESDKLMDASFTEDVKHIYNALNPETTQVAAFSATYPNNLDEYLSGFMKAPVTFRLDATDVQLLGIHQYALGAMKQQATSLIPDILDKMSFSQAVIFANDTTTCSSIYDAINSAGKHKAAIMSGNLDQDERKKVITALKNFAVRIMVSTDVTARGIDALNVNLVINVGVPKDPETYLHRIGRAGRYGGNGASITLLTSPQELSKFVRMAKNAKLNVKALEYANIPYDLTYNEEFFKDASYFVDHYSKKDENVKAKVSDPPAAQDQATVAASDATPDHEKETTEKHATDSNAAAPIPSTSALTPEEETPAASPDALPKKERVPCGPFGHIPSTSHIGPVDPASRSTSGTSQISTKSYGGLLSEFTLKKNIPDWDYNEPIQRAEKIEVPLALLDVEKVRQYVPGFVYDEEAATANAIKDRANQPVITGVVWVPPVPRRARLRGATAPSGGRGRGGYNNDGNSRGGYNNEGGYTRGGRGGGDGYRRGGNYGASRGGYNNEGAPQRGGYNNDGYSRGGYNNEGPSRGGYNNEDAPQRGGYNNDGPSRGGYNNEGGYGRGGRGGTDLSGFGRGASRGGNGADGTGFGRGGANAFNNSRGGYEASRGGYGTSTRGMDGASRGGGYDSRRGGQEEGFGRGGYRGGFNNDENNGRGGYMGGSRGRGNFNQQHEDEVSEQNSYVPRRRFVR